MSSRFLEVDSEGDVTIVRINRPPVNAIDPELAADGAALLDELAAEPGGAVVITGSGQSFSAGLDIKIAPTLDDEQQREMRVAINRLLGGWALFPRPLVTAVNGHAIAGGLILALSGDWRVVGQQGQFGLTEVNVLAPLAGPAYTHTKRALRAGVARALEPDAIGDESWLTDDAADRARDVLS